jgi:DNA-3-methyladenine glycosylase II
LTPDDYTRAGRLLARRDPVLRSIIRQCGPCGLAAAQRKDHFTALARAIVGQQVSTHAAAAVFGRVAALMPVGEVTPEGLLAAPIEGLRAAGLSRQKLGYLVDLAGHVADERLRLEELDDLPDEAVIERLTDVKGIGRWSAEMFLIFRLHRPDVLPVGDLGIVRAIQRAYRLWKPPTPVRIRKLAEPWRPYRSVACWYLWASLRNTPR